MSLLLFVLHYVKNYKNMFDVGYIKMATVRLQ